MDADVDGVNRSKLATGFYVASAPLSGNAVCEGEFALDVPWEHPRAGPRNALVIETSYKHKIKECDAGS